MNDQVQQPGYVSLAGVGGLDLGVEQADQPLDVAFFRPRIGVVKLAQQVQDEGDVPGDRTLAKAPSVDCARVLAQLPGKPSLGQAHAG